MEESVALTREKIQALEQLVEQLQLGHIKESNRPWNTPVFVIKKTIRQMETLRR